MRLHSWLCAAGCIAALTVSAGPLLAQIDPDDSGVGEKLGLGQRHNSGQVGTVTLFRRGAAGTLAIVVLFSEPPGRAEPARISRGRSCITLQPAAAYVLAPVVNGTSRTLVPAAEAKLLSGNYSLAARASRRAGRDVSCGELHH